MNTRISIVAMANGTWSWELLRGRHALCKSHHTFNRRSDAVKSANSMARLMVAEPDVVAEQ